MRIVYNSIHIIVYNKHIESQYLAHVVERDCVLEAGVFVGGREAVRGVSGEDLQLRGRPNKWV
jgi:hypothetical protein